MNAAILVKNNVPLIVDNISLPGQLSFGQVLVQVHYSGICGSQLNEIDGVKGPDKFFPHLLGHEGSGIVQDIGHGVKTVKKGDYVVLHWRPSNGIQSETPTYQWGAQKVNAGWITTFNEYAIISENRLTPIPKDFDLKLASLFGCAVTSAFGVINNDAQVKIGQSVAVFGTGGVGLNIVQAASLVSAHPIIGVDIYDSKLEMAKQFGATDCFNSLTISNLEKAIYEAVNPLGADVVIDTTGNTKVIELAYKLTHPDGKTILVGVPKKDDNISIYSLPLHFNKVLKGSHGGSAKPHIDIPRYIRLYNAKKIHLDGLITHEFNLDQINQAIELMRSGKTGRCVIKVYGN